MMKNLVTSLLLLAAAPLAYAQQQSAAVPITAGVSRQLADQRFKNISNIHYALSFTFPASKTAVIPAKEKITFSLKNAGQTLQLDFKQPTQSITALVVNGKSITPAVQEEHVVIEPSLLKQGKNEIELTFLAGDGSLNRNNEFLYALFVPDRARFVFPCFDQPDLKATYDLTVAAPSAWTVLANGTTKDSVVNTDGTTTWHFATTEKLPTYLFSFVAGMFKSAVQDIKGQPVTLLYREKDPGSNIDSIFRLHRESVSFLEKWTGIPYPFQKMGYAAIPDFQFGGMEHPGVVHYKASSFFLQSPTKDQLLSRTQLISHETAHMWFGDLVTMKWFNDVWMKEVFANFMADKVAEDILGSEQFNLRFLQDHYPRAYNVDRTKGANPIRQQLDNLKDAGTMYGDIIYHKAPVMMRQIELLMGKDNFRKGVREYLKKYAYSNASWDDLIAILARYTKKDLYKWNAVWVNQPHRPVFDYQISYSGNRIKDLELTQHPEFGGTDVWPQLFDIAFVYPDAVKTIQVDMNAARLKVKGAAGLPKPQYILFNASGLGYGLFPSDTAINPHLFTTGTSLNRASAYLTAYENMLAGRYYKPQQPLQLFATGLAIEKEETSIKQLTNYISALYWEFTTPADRNALAAALENQLWAALEQQPSGNNRKLIFKAYQDIYTSVEAGERMYKIWASQQAPEGVKLAEEDYISLALTISLKNDTAISVIPQQISRLKDEDKKDRLRFLIPALSAGEADRDQFFASLREREGRSKEAWVVSALYYLHHPLRQQTSRKYLPESLQLLEDIQRTGDIFFPANWLNAIFGNYQDAEAWNMVQVFLDSHPDYNPKLKAKILQSTDNLARARQLLKL
ncbi:aminopeptidase N [Chitinophaga jiangningensis]|uniref:Aminopeptidase N n=1 Tax=Chitinophaga jiangningensis TaxID=1419482 RepID=A0A1M6Y490_9BACT|nr:M1 family aminopeptidase [Chitinophaga jiangningensis]SHL12805.1 aminopeptidase N [Chitinophaga jiangningensis]